MRSLKSRTVLLVALWLFGCGGPDDGVEMLNAASSEEVKETRLFPAVVMIAMPDSRGICTGTFISPRTLLTAAHCTLLAGSYRIYSSFGSYVTSNKEALGPGTLNDPNDISVLLFSSDVADPSQGYVLALGTQPEERSEIRIIGYGCNDIDTKRGAGKKRTGTNLIYSIGDYIELLSTPTAQMRTNHASRSILGSDNQAGSCSGDSGGPMLQVQDNAWRITGVTHAGGWTGNRIKSQYIDLNRTENMSFLRDVDSEYDLHLFDGCWTSSDPEACGEETASFRFLSFLKPLIYWFLSLIW